jgi:hypothetical protein
VGDDIAVTEGTYDLVTTGVDTGDCYGAFVAEFNFGNPRCSNIFGCITTKIGLPPAILKGLGVVA